MLSRYPPNGTTTGIQMPDVVPQGVLAMQHDEKLKTMKLIMLSSEGGITGQAY
jgi:hypothetical protein